MGSRDQWLPVLMYIGACWRRLYTNESHVHVPAAERTDSIQSSTANYLLRW